MLVNYLAASYEASEIQSLFQTFEKF